MHPLIDQNSIDHNIDEVLTAIGTATPPSGVDAMNARLLHAIQHRALTAAPRSRTRFWLPLSLAASLAAFLVLITTMLLHQHRQPAAATSHTSPITPTQHAVITPRAARTPAPQPHRVLTARVQNKVHDESVPLQLSHPAPPAPLTAQEKLLLRLVHNDDPRELALLNTELQEQQFEALKKSFADSITQPQENSGESQ
jgi:hypothetical protein